MEISLTYSDIAFVPRNFSTILSRDGDDVDPSIMFLDRKLRLPILSAPMKKVTGAKMARKLTTLGCLPILMRTDDGQADLREFLDSADVPGASGVSLGATGDYLERAAKFIQAGARIICIDTANGFHAVVGHAISQLKKSKIPIKIIAGNIGSVEAYRFLHKMGADAVRVGIGNGSACSTSIATGIGMGQISLLKEISEYRNHLTSIKQIGPYPLPAVIADGGITEPGDISKAIAFGADVVMVGRYLAGADESPAELVQTAHGPMKEYAGEASRSLKGSKKHVEGVSTLIPYTGPVADTIQELEDGLRSCMGYMNCRTLDEIRKLPENCFTRLSSNARYERTPHALTSR